MLTQVVWALSVRSIGLGGGWADWLIHRPWAIISLSQLEINSQIDSVRVSRDDLPGEIPTWIQSSRRSPIQPSGLIEHYFFQVRIHSPAAVFQGELESGRERTSCFVRPEQGEILE